MSARPKPKLRLASLHFTYGLGALCAPLAAAEFLNSGLDFSKFYSVGLALAVCNTFGVTSTFRLQKSDGLRNENLVEEAEVELELEDRNNNNSNTSNNQEDQITNPSSLRQRNISRQEEQPSLPLQDYSKTSTKFKSILSQPNVWFLSIFALLYVGTEVSIGGWSSTYIIQVRGSTNDSNYIVSGFWAGVAFGRILLIPVTSWLGDQLAVLIYLGLAIGLQFIVWLVPNLIANAVSLAIMGLLIGPSEFDIRFKCTLLLPDFLILNSLFHSTLLASLSSESLCPFP